MTATLRDQVLSLGELSIAVSAIAAVVMMTLRYFVKHVDTRIEHHLRMIDHRLDRVEKRTEQLIPNGGSSLADSIHRLEARQLSEVAEQKAIRRALEQHLTEHRAIGDADDPHR